MKKYDNRKYYISAIILFFIFVIVFKLINLQIFDESLKISAENNSQRRITEYPARGLIYDRYGNLLVYNEAAYDLMLIPRKMKEFDTLSLCRDLNIDISDFYARLEKCISFSSFRPSVFYKQITAQQYSTLQEHLFKYPGFFVQNRTLRKYTSSLGAHILGDIGEIDKETLEKNPYYTGGDYIGKSGVEKYYETVLRGKKGVKIFLVDVHNNIQGSYMNGKYDTLAIPGKDLYLTIDSALQAYGERLMKNKVGSIVAIDPNNGEILALVSSPTYDPQLLVGRNRGKNYDSLLNAKSKPLINRAISSTYPPGSIFKIAQALVGLQEGVLKPNTFYPCDVSLVGCHGHPPAQGVARAIQYSCNPYFYMVFRSLVQRKIEKSIFKDSRIGLQLWKEKITGLGFDKAFDIGLPGVNKGQIPGPDYYDRKYGKYRWAFSTIYSLGIGQGEVLVSPLQMANFCAIIANKGYYYNPHIVKQIGTDSVDRKNYMKIFTPFDKKHFDVIIEGMEYAVNEDYGTGRNAIISGMRVCGKTGTVQNPHGKDHSVFIAFAPKDEPKIAIAVYVENAGFGGVWAAPIARLMMEKYLLDSIIDPDIEKIIFETKIDAEQ
ncbi:MAG: penicillin-binding protein 2 [Bacteroidales bacterium]|jgi:penicillin-binding protein 2|nr:penicillin-binding protein 2 [Bacteroidales bacterium]HOL99000.1 penicillin-binding protein 2 [Bacteroidales bacterium]HOM37303.1 penicillin-binding protein 2 [Bacteroidales bacterium]HPD24801.1 penicillin-binding protein 2 [Bacteroidales bacterium]HRT00578.1 penicillin-binding protein 2 [Bacteroidales bacterium]